MVAGWRWHSILPYTIEFYWSAEDVYTRHMCRLLFLFVCVCRLKKWCYYLQSLSLCRSLYRSLKCYCCSIIKWRGQKRERENCTIFTLFFIRMRPVSPSFNHCKQYLYTYVHTHTHSYTDVIGDRSIKSYTHIHSFTCRPSIALDLLLVSSSHI